MIDKTSDTLSSTPAAAAASRPANQRVVQHTPFGDVLVDEITTANIFGLVTTGQSTGQSSAAPQTTQPTSTPSSVATPPLTQSAVGPLTIQEASAMTADALFGDHPWIDNPTGTGGVTPWSYNPVYFATRQTAEKIATLIGGKVVEQNAMTPYGGLRQQVPNEMIELPNGKVLNAGLIANFFAHGYSQSFVNRLLQLETQGA